MPGKHHSVEEKALAMAAVRMAGSANGGAAMAGLPASTVRGWIQQYEAMGDSELEAFIASKQRALGGVWTTMQEQALELAAEKRIQGDAKGMQAAMVAAGIAFDKTRGMGQPKAITTYASTEDRTLLDAFQTPTEAQSPVEPHDKDAR